MSIRKNDKLQTLAEQYDAIVDLFDKSQLKGSENTVDMDAVSKDLKPSQFTEKGTDYASDKPIKANPQLDKYPEMDRYCFDHSFEKDTLVTGKDSGRTPIFGKTDPTADKQ